MTLSDDEVLQKVFTADVLDRIDLALDQREKMYQDYEFDAFWTRLCDTIATIRSYLYDSYDLQKFHEKYGDDSSIATRRMLGRQCDKLYEYGVEFPEWDILRHDMVGTHFRGQYVDLNELIDSWEKKCGVEVTGNILRAILTEYNDYSIDIGELDRDVFDSEDPYDAVCELYGTDFFGNIPGFWDYQND